jgi:hypothetical protein
MRILYLIVARSMLAGCLIVAGCALPTTAANSADDPRPQRTLNAGIGPFPRLLGSQDGYGEHPDPLSSPTSNDSH